MTTQEYYSIRQTGNFSIAALYEYYTDNINKAVDQKIRPFEEFSAAFPIWWEQRVDGFAKYSIIRRVTEYFDQKFSPPNPVT